MPVYRDKKTGGHLIREERDQRRTRQEAEAPQQQTRLISSLPTVSAAFSVSIRPRKQANPEEKCAAVPGSHMCRDHAGLICAEWSAVEVTER